MKHLNLFNALLSAFVLLVLASFIMGLQLSLDGTKLVVNGAYRLAAWMPQAMITLERNPMFRDAAPIARVRFHVTEDAAAELQRFAAGDLHITETVPPQPLPQLRARFGERLRISPYVGAFWLGGG